MLMQMVKNKPGRDAQGGIEGRNREGQSKRLIESHRKVLDYLLNNPDAKLIEVATNCSLSLGGVKKIVQSFKNEGLIKREGNKKSGRWMQ